MIKQSDIWKHKQRIKNGSCVFRVNDEVILLHRKKSTYYPAKIKDDTTYIVRAIEGDYLIVYDKLANKDFSISKIKVNMYYLVHIGFKRDLILREILNEDN